MSNNKISGIVVGSILADIRGGLFSKEIGDFNGKKFKFTYDAYKICGFDVNYKGDLISILCNQILSYDSEHNPVVISKDVTRFPVSDYREYLFMEDSFGLYEKARELREKFQNNSDSQKEDCSENIKPNMMLLGKVKSSLDDDVEIYRRVYILEVLEDFFDERDYIRFTTCSYTDLEDTMSFEGPFLLSIQDFQDIMVDGFLKFDDFLDYCVDIKSEG